MNDSAKTACSTGPLRDEGGERPAASRATASRAGSGRQVGAKGQNGALSESAHESAPAGGEYLLAIDTANEVVAVGVARIGRASGGASGAPSIAPLAHRETAARRASNRTLIPLVEECLSAAGASKHAIAAVVCGRGPGSFTGVRICLAAAKGMASALEVPLYGVSTLDAIAWRAWAEGARGRVLVTADAMRKEIYPSLYAVSDEGVRRMLPDAVVKAADAIAWVGDAVRDCEERDPAFAALPDRLSILGDGLVKYRDVLGGAGDVLPEALWAVSGDGLLLAAGALAASGGLDISAAAWHGPLVPDGSSIPPDYGETGVSGVMDGRAPASVRPRRGDPAVLLPVYTRLSDAEENERARLAKEAPSAPAAPRDLASGVQHAPLGAETAGKASAATPGSIVYRPLDAAHAADVAAMEKTTMGTDAWSASLVADELPRKDRTWWAAYEGPTLVGYCGGWVVDGQVQILKIAVDPARRRLGIAAELLARVAEDARALGATEATLEVRAGNEGAQAFYERAGLSAVGTRPRYYSDREDAVIMTGPLPTAPTASAGPASGRAPALAAASRAARAEAAEYGEFDPGARTVAGMRLHVDQVSSAPVARDAPRPMILAIESSCDETAASVIDGEGGLLSDVVASQIDFHARFGGVVPEIASRKHIEAICGVCDECLASAGRTLAGASADGASGAAAPVRWRDLDAVAVTYAPGLVGALVVGVAFAKGAAWGADVPLIAVNHLEGHLYANKIARADIRPPMVVSLVSGGHTMLVHVRDWGDYATLGSTIDDAVGEAFDKVAKALGLGYPGGPIISRLAEQGDPHAIDFPRALLHSGDLRFSLSGLKTAVSTYIQKERDAGRDLNLPDIAASFEAAVVDVQVAKAAAALRETGAKEFCLGGGVAANPMLRAAYGRMCERLGVRLTLPPMSACGDQAAMIAEVALDRYRQGRFSDWTLDVAAHAPLDEAY